MRLLLRKGFCRFFLMLAENKSLLLFVCAVVVVVDFWLEKKFVLNAEGKINVKFLTPLLWSVVLKRLDASRHRDSRKQFLKVQNLEINFTLNKILVGEFSLQISIWNETQTKTYITFIIWLEKHYINNFLFYINLKICLNPNLKPKMWQTLFESIKKWNHYLK